ncbi:type II 3-dehydroquinate dehydratase [Demequina zhanjiangensis]|uniref:3-dehydroquinate dehydratase n=1 Tax=Demequina zhanjiangensis TaxID=3051659 RepID=A0ABT8G3R7_9MICO|nr:type II 3-dehydroquinate dehydratase [Demequina sp. SYSU T00b26]MDN4473344.1 type II 3-dehydroquinate dehydratase [Demequina sp. SYSU T00b26]
MTTVLIANGPNLGRLGSREPEKYGSTSFDALSQLCRGWADEILGATADVRQTDDESELVGWMHQAVDAGTPVILNPAAFTHYSYALRDACAMVTAASLPLIEIHLTNPHAREEFRHTSVISGIATGTIAGFGTDSYRLAITALAGRLG